MKKKTIGQIRRKRIKISQVMKIIGLVLVLLLAVAATVVIKYWSEEPEPEEIIKVNKYDGEEKTYVLESDKLLFELDSQTTYFKLTAKANGHVWYSNPQDAANDTIALTTEKNKLRSTLLLTYSNKNGVDTQLDNYAYSIEHRIYQIEEGKDFIKIYYSVGNVEKEYVIPAVMEEERMLAILNSVSSNDKVFITDYYKKYDINKLGKKDNEEELLERYPLLEEYVLYTLRDTTNESIKKKLEGIFEAAGYTYEEFLEDREKDTAIKVTDKPVFNISVIYRLINDELQVEVPFDEIEYKDGYPIYYLSLLPYFGAAGVAENGYIMVPEGGGGLIDFNNGRLAQSSYYADMYGWDMALDREAVVNETGTSFNAFGIARDNAAFVCILDNGAPYASIRADISGRSNSYNYVNAVYNMVHRERYEVSNQFSGNFYVYEPGLPQGEKILQRYRFVDSGSYVDMANAYREYLLDKYGDDFEKREDSQTPVVIELVGAVDKIGQVLGVPVSKPLELTTFAEAEQIITELAADGLSNMSVKLTGWMNGGVKQKILKSVRIVSKLGSKKELKNLINKANDLGVKVYLDGVTSYAYDSSLLNGFFVFNDAARFVSKEKAELYKYSTVTFGKRFDLNSFYLLRPSVIDKMVNNLAKAADSYSAGVSFADLGSELSSDFNRKERVSRQQVMENQMAKFKELQDKGIALMFNTGNDYSLAFSDIISNMKLNGANYSVIDRSVPFYQLAIHGYVNYSGEPLNLAANENFELLRSAEYGAGLAFTLMDENPFTLQNSLYTMYFGAEYASWRDRLLKIYSSYNSQLGHVFNQRMTDHKYLDNGLTCTSYEDGTRVYVNYAYEDMLTDEGRTVPARDYIVVR